jgi:hypothetical protein
MVMLLVAHMITVNVWIVVPLTSLKKETSNAQLVHE